MDTQSDLLSSWLTPAWVCDDAPTSQLDSQWWGKTQTLDSDDFGASASDNFYLPPAIDMPGSYYGLDDTNFFSLPSEAAISSDSPSLFGSVDDDTALMMSPPTTPTTPGSPSMASPLSLSSPVDDGGFSVDSVKSSSKSRRTSGPKMRTSVSKGKSSKSTRKSSTPEDAGSPKLQRARICHNVVEKNYRNRLNGQFELMLATLNKSRARSGESFDEIDTAYGDYDRAPSKSAVLQLARERLISLEKENESMRHKIERLQDSANFDFTYSRTALI